MNPLTLLQPTSYDMEEEDAKGLRKQARWLKVGRTTSAAPNTPNPH